VTEEEALRAYARMMNTGEVGALAPLLPPDFRYASQMVLAEIESAAEFLDYITGKLEAIAQGGADVFAEMGVIAHGPQGVPGMEGRPCVLMAQGGRDEVKAVVMASVEDGVLRRLDMCMIVPRPENAIRSGEYPT
jgi:hypothetical protein